MHALLAIWAKYPDKRHRVTLALLALRFKNEADVGFVDGSRQLAERVAQALADKDQVSPAAESLANQLLDRYAADPMLAMQWLNTTRAGRAPYFEGLNRQDMAFALQPWLEARVGCQVPWERIAARKSLVLKGTFYQLLRHPWDSQLLQEWLVKNHTLIMAAIMGMTIRQFTALEEARTAYDAEQAQASASYLCGACDSPDLLQAGESCRLCGNTDTVALTTASTGASTRGTGSGR